MSASRFEKMLWPRWLPETARMPLIAQVTGAVALTALIMGPWWSRVPSASTPSPAPLPATAPAAEIGTEPLKPAVTPAPVAQPAARPAHLNLDVRHSFSSADLSVTVDGKRVLDSTLEGSSKKFRMFGKREQRSFTRSLDLPPGVRVVNIRLKSPQDKFDQTRTERFELGAASVASMRITAERNALDVIAQHPPIEPAPVAVPTTTTPSPAVAPVSATAVPIPAPVSPLPAAQRADAVAELVQSVRSMLIAIAGFIASAATGFVVQEFMRSKKGVMFSQRGGRRRRGQDDEEAVEAP